MIQMKKTLAAFVASTIFLTAPVAAFAADIIRGDIIAQEAEVEVVFDKGIVHLEGPVYGPDGMVYFSDITITGYSGMTAGVIWKNDPSTNETTVFRSPSGMSNGIAFDANGNMIVAEGADFGGRRLTFTDKDTGISKIIAGTYDGDPFNAPNDLDIDSKGRIYFTDPRYFGYESLDQPVFGVYRIDTDGKISLILADLSHPNGIAISPDEKTLYVTDGDFRITDIALLSAGIPLKLGPQEIVAYDLTDGVPSNRRTFKTFEGKEAADGIKVDEKGNLYATIRAAGIEGVHVYSAEGEELAYVPTEAAPTNVMLADIDGKIYMYYTSGTTLYRIQTLVKPRSFTTM